MLAGERDQVVISAHVGWGAGPGIVSSGLQFLITYVC